MIDRGFNSEVKVLDGSKRIGDFKHLLASIIKAQKLLDYKPVVKFDQGIKRNIYHFIKKNIENL